MATLDEISKEKQRVSEALARVDAQREKLAGQLGELEATERVLARYSKGVRARRRPQPARRSRQQRRLLQRDQAGARVLRSRSQPATGAALRASAIRSLPWQVARRSKKLPLHVRGSPQPCRRRHFQAQAGGPDRRARREALRHAVEGGRSNARDLTPG